MRRRHMGLATELPPLEEIFMLPLVRAMENV
jgi:hypothetical protein